MGVCHPVLQILTLLQTKNAIFHTIHTRFLTSSLGRNYVIITYIRAQTKHFSNAFRIRIFAFLSYSFGIDTINTFIHSHSSLKNFRPRRCKNCTWWGSRYLYSLYKGVPPPPPSPKPYLNPFWFDLGQTLESTEHVSANVSEPICLEMLICWNGILRICLTWLDRIDNLFQSHILSRFFIMLLKFPSSFWLVFYVLIIKFISTLYLHYFKLNMTVDLPKHVFKHKKLLKQLFY